MSNSLLKGHSNSKMDQTWKCCQSAPSQKAKNNKVRCQVVDSTSHHCFCLYRRILLQTDFLRKSVSSKDQQDFEEKGKSFTSDVYNEFNASSYYSASAQSPFWTSLFCLTCSELDVSWPKGWSLKRLLGTNSHVVFERLKGSMMNGFLFSWDYPCSARACWGQPKFDFSLFI